MSATEQTVTESVHESIERQINDVTATERPQGARVVWRSEALKIAEKAYATGFGDGQRHGYDAAQTEAQGLRTAYTLAESSLNDWAEFDAELTDLLADYLPEVDGDGSHHSVLIDCVRAALARAHEKGAAGEPGPQTKAVRS